MRNQNLADTGNGFWKTASDASHRLPAPELQCSGYACLTLLFCILETQLNVKLLLSRPLFCYNAVLQMVSQKWVVTKRYTMSKAVLRKMTLVIKIRASQNEFLRTAVLRDAPWGNKVPQSNNFEKHFITCHLWETMRSKIKVLIPQGRETGQTLLNLLSDLAWRVGSGRGHNAYKIYFIL